MDPGGWMDLDPWICSKDWGFCIVHIDKNEQKMGESDVLFINLSTLYFELIIYCT